MAFEERWVRVILGSFAPEAALGLSPREGEVDYVATFRGMRQSARPVARIGLRLALWLIALSPVWLTGRPRTLTDCALRARQALLARLLDHRAFAVREAALVLKLAACLALFASDAVRARSGYDTVAVAPTERLSLLRKSAS